MSEETGSTTPTPAELKAIEIFFESMGVSELYDGAAEYLRMGYRANQVPDLLSRDERYQEAFFRRFPAIKRIREENAQRTARGEKPIPEPTLAEYVSLEAGYRLAVRDLPGTWATPENIATWIAGETSPAMVTERISIARDYINNDLNPEVRRELREMYGLSDQDMIQYVLSDAKSREELAIEFEQRERKANVGAAARVQGISLSEDLRRDIAQSNDNAGSFGQTSMMFSSIAAQADSYKRLGAISGVGTSTDDLVRDSFNLEGGAEARKNKRRLASQERSRFGGSAGLGRSSLSRGGIGSQ